MKTIITPVPVDPEFEPFKVEIEIRTAAEGLALLAMLNSTSSKHCGSVAEIARLNPCFEPVEYSAMNLFSNDKFSDNIYLPIRQALIKQLEKL